MTQDMWKLFPQMIVEKINGLLTNAVPNRIRAYQIYKNCQNENLWKDSFAQFTLYLDDFFSQPAENRSKASFDSYLERPMHKSLYEMFQLDFRSAHIEPAELRQISNWTHNMMRINCTASPCLIEQEIFEKTLHAITHPHPTEKLNEIEFEDFCQNWKRIVFQIFGKRYDSELNRILNELRLLDKELRMSEQEKVYRTLISLTQTEIDWTEAVLKAVQERLPLPSYPLMRGPQKPALIQIEKVVQLYNIVSVSREPQIQEHLEKVTSTLVFRCQELLRNCAR